MDAGAQDPHDGIEAAMNVGDEIRKIEQELRSLNRRITNIRQTAIGEANTASNQGVGGVGLYDAKVGVDLQFRNIIAASARIDVALDAPNKEVEIDAVTGIADGNLLEVNGAPANDEYAKWTANGLEGRDYDEVLADLSAQALAAFSWNNQNLTSVGTIGLVGGQIAFPAAQVPSADGNTLDDYEEGTWTPDLQFGGAKVGIGYVRQDGEYTKKGREVTVTCYIGLSSKGTSVGVAEIYGLPFTLKNSYGTPSPPSFWIYKISFADFFNGYAFKNQTHIILQEITNAGVTSSITNADFAGDSSMMISMTYFTD